MPIRRQTRAVADVMLVRPAPGYLGDYTVALERGWSPDTFREEAAAREQLAAIARDPKAFLDSLDDPRATGAPIRLPDGSMVPRLPGFVRWMWDEAFCGSIGFRWQPGTSELPAHVLGHIGFSVVPWRRRRGYATRALALMLREAAGQGLRHVELTTDPTNTASQRVIAANAGILVERFRKAAAYGGAEALRFRIMLDVTAGG